MPPLSVLDTNRPGNCLPHPRKLAYHGRTARLETLARDDISANSKGATMGLFWDLLQQSQISSQSHRADSLEQRVASLENDVRENRRLLQRLLEVLENRFGQDIDGDGRVG